VPGANHGAEVTTVEGVSGPAGLSAAQSALSKHGAFQCGFCTSGAVMVIEELLTDPDIVAVGKRE
jgi:aerobic carbon-monoxide dehydrogenase small subunit